MAFLDKMGSLGRLVDTQVLEEEGKLLLLEEVLVQQDIHQFLEVGLVQPDNLLVLGQQGMAVVVDMKDVNGDEDDDVGDVVDGDVGDDVGGGVGDEDDVPWKTLSSELLLPFDDPN